MAKLGGPQAHSRFETELGRVTRTLERYGVLTDDVLRDLCQAGPLEPGRLHPVLEVGVREGCLKRLGSNFYELAEPPRH